MNKHVAKIYVEKKRYRLFLKIGNKTSGWEIRQNTVFRFENIFCFYYINRMVNFIMMKKSVKCTLPSIFLLIASLSLSCVYFNTYYNAETAFDFARKEQTRLNPDPLPDSGFTITSTIEEKLKRTAEKAILLKANYPKSRRWHDNALYLLAKAYYYQNDRSRAIRTLKEFQTTFPGSEFISQSYVLLAQAYLLDDQLDKAETVVKFILEKYPYLDADGDIALITAKIALRHGGLSIAIGQLEKVYQSNLTIKRKLELSIKLAGFYVDLGQYEKAIRVCISAPRPKEMHSTLYPLDKILLDSYLALDSCSTALAQSELMLKNVDYRGHLPPLYYSQGLALICKGNVSEAIKVFERLTSRYASDPSTGLAWYELGCIYQNRGEREQARMAYEKAVATLKDNKLKETARLRSRALAELQTYYHRIDSTSDSTKVRRSTALDTLYKIGEIYWLQLAQPDTAVAVFSTIVADTHATGTQQAQALFAIAWIKKHVENDTITADSLFRSITFKYPEVRVVLKKIQQERGDSVTILTRQDSSWIAFESAQSLLFGKKDTVNALNAYESVYVKYRELEAGTQALLLCGYINDEYLNKNKTAISFYKKLCEEYPDSRYCKEGAKPRIDAVEDSLKSLKSGKSKSVTGKKSIGRQLPDSTLNSGMSRDLRNKSLIEPDDSLYRRGRQEWIKQDMPQPETD